MAGAMLEKAKLLAKEVEVDLDVCFNPKELNIDKSASWEPMDKLNDEPFALFGEPSPASLSVTLIFDTYEAKESVYRRYTSKLERLIHVISKEVRRPPLALFVWGSFCFQGVVENLGQKYTMFLPTGMPVRAECTLKMKKVRGAVRRGALLPSDPPEKFAPYTRLWQGR